MILEVPANAEAMASEEHLREIAACAQSFEHFLRYWRFINTEKGKSEMLGEELWPGQRDFIDCMDNHRWIFALKARKLGFTTIECAYDAWVARFGPSHARVHLFSRREKAAQELLSAVKYGLRNLPSWMQMPVGDLDNKNEYTLDCSYTDESGEYVEDIRRIVAYPADETTAVEQTCQHGHVDEWARMRNPRSVWQAIEPTMAGSCHIITTGQGPQNYSSEFWRRAMAGDEPVHPFFVPALSRPDRDERWLKLKYRGDRRKALQEYPMRWEDALSGGGEYVFDHEALDLVGVDALGMQLDPVPGRKYLKAWDVGRHKDAAVGIVYDITDEVHDVVAYWRLRELPYPMLQARIEKVHYHWPGKTYVEKNAAGEAVIENCNISPEAIEGIITSPNSKAKMIELLQSGFQSETIKYDPRELEQLDAEVRGYQIPDDDLVQDSVMTLGIAEYAFHTKPKAGRFLGVQKV